jgi:hypothetical protein
MSVNEPILSRGNDITNDMRMDGTVEALVLLVIHKRL